MIEFLVYSNIYLACGTVALAYATTVSLGCALTAKALLLPFANGLFIYTLDRYTAKGEDSINMPGRVRFFERWGLWLMVGSALLYLLALVFALREGPLVAILLLAPLAIGIVYSFGGLKKLTFGKNLSVGMAWGSTALLAGAICGDITRATWIYFAFFSLECFVNTVMFDVRDIQGDREHGVRTLPVVLGLPRALLVCHALNALAILGVVASVAVGWLPTVSLILAGMGAYIMLYTLLCSEERGRHFFGLVIDGEFIFLLVAFFVYQLLHTAG